MHSRETSTLFNQSADAKAGTRRGGNFAAPMLAELDAAAHELNVSRQAVIKTMLRQALDQHYLAASTSKVMRVPKRG